MSVSKATNDSDSASWSAENLPQMPRFLHEIIDDAKKNLDLKRITIFGSRARGDHSARSDYDLAFELTSEKNWNRFIARKDDFSTLLPIDLVLVSELNADYLESIAKEGVTLFEN